MSAFCALIGQSTLKISRMMSTPGVNDHFSHGIGAATTQFMTQFPAPYRTGRGGGEKDFVLCWWNVPLIAASRFGGLVGSLLQAADVCFRHLSPVKHHQNCDAFAKRLSRSQVIQAHSDHFQEPRAQESEIRQSLVKCLCISEVDFKTHS